MWAFNTLTFNLSRESGCDNWYGQWWTFYFGSLPSWFWLPVTVQPVLPDFFFTSFQWSSQYLHACSVSALFVDWSSSCHPSWGLCVSPPLILGRFLPYPASPVDFCAFCCYSFAFFLRFAPSQLSKRWILLDSVLVIRALSPRVMAITPFTHEECTFCNKWLKKIVLPFYMFSSCFFLLLLHLDFLSSAYFSNPPFTPKSDVSFIQQKSLQE